MAHNQFTTHNNPLNHGGWAGAGDLPFPPGTPREGSLSPAPSSHSSSSSSSSASVNGWTLAQSSFGALPISAVPGASPPNLLGPSMQLRFMARRNQTELCIVSSNRTCYMIKTSMYQSILSTPASQIAIITWPSGTPGSIPEPIVNRYGLVKRMSEFLQDVPGSNVKVLNVLDRILYWVIDRSGITITLNMNAPQSLGYVKNYNGVVVNIVQEGLQDEMLHFIIIAAILIQGRAFVGIR